MDVLKALQALADPTRMAVFNCIRGCGGASAYDCETGECDANEPGGVALCDVKCKVPCSPSTLTHHLNVLRDADLVWTERRGRKAYVQIRVETLRALAAFLLETK
ncbi:MAG: helix-turn-helix transcriptional regulator [Armatimonadetes bacterium]|nr:helix-turn-helix transcriptional regulator [Armatimonadota bacterium]